MKLGTPSTIEMAVMFLYGKRPKLTEDNIDHMLHLAEFLLIPNLKSACISWLQTVNIIEENCMDLLQLSSIFAFDIPACTEYIEGNMPEMLRQSKMLNLTNDSIERLFVDKKLCYVPMDDKLTFLLRWRDRRPDVRSNYFKDLLATIDFHEVSKALLLELYEDRTLSEIIDFEKVFDGLNDELTAQRVLIMKGEIGKASFWCLDIGRNRWFRIDSRALEEEDSSKYLEMNGKGAGDFDIYFITSAYRQFKIPTLNLQSDTYKTFKLVDRESGEYLQHFHDLSIDDDICVVNINEKVKTNKQYKQKHQSSQSIGVCRPVRITPSPQYIDTSTLYIGHMFDENVQMSPLLTFKDDRISQFCIGKSLTIALLLQSSEFIFLYDLVDNSLERIKLHTYFNDKLTQSENGFIIYNHERCICLTRQTGRSLSEKYILKEVSFEGDRFQENRLFFCGKTWYRYYRKSYNDSPTFESLPHDCLTSVNSTENLSWNPLPLPVEYSRCYGEIIKERCFEICLPKSKLRCDIECPHCKVVPRTTTSTVTYYHDFDDDYYCYDGSSDDEYYVYCW